MGPQQTGQQTEIVLSWRSRSRNLERGRKGLPCTHCGWEMTQHRFQADLAALKLVVLLRWHFFLPELLHVWRWRKAKNLQPAPNTDRVLKVCYKSSAAASELVFSPLIRRESGDNTPMLNRNKSETDLISCFLGTAKNTLVIVSGCRKADISRYLFLITSNLISLKQFE